MKLLDYLRYAGKAVIAGTVTFAASAALASQDGWTQPEVWTVVGATAIAIGGVFGFTNGNKPQG